MSARVQVAGEARTGVDDLLAASILVVDGRELSGRDLLAAGVVSGRWQQLERELWDGLGLVAAEPPPDAEVNEVVRAFRLERDLLSAEDLRGWMEGRGLTFAAIKAVAARTLARGSGGASQAISAAQVAEALPAEAICTGTLRQIGLWLADRILSAATSGADQGPIKVERTEVQRLISEESRTVAGAASPDSGPERSGRLAWIVALDDAYREWETAVIGTREVMRRLREQELEWCRFELDELRLDSAGAAAEAARQLAEGVDPRQIAAAAGVPLTAQSVVLADAPPELARTLAGAVVGEVAGPWNDGDAQVVARVRERHIPSPEDEQIVARAREELLADTVMRLRAGRVRWHERA